MQRLWKQDTQYGSVLESGPALVRIVERIGDTLALTGDADKDLTTTVWAPFAVQSIT